MGPSPRGIKYHSLRNATIFRQGHPVWYMAASASDPDSPGDVVDLSEPREIQIKLPVSIHVKLQSLKIAKGKQIRKVVLEALEAYFKTVDQEKQHR